MINYQVQNIEGLIKKLKEKEILDPSFQKKLVNYFSSIRPFFDYMSEILTTNLNGESTI